MPSEQSGREENDEEPCYKCWGSSENIAAEAKKKKCETLRKSLVLFLEENL